MLPGRSLAGEEAERVRDAIRRLVSSAGTQTAAAKQLSVTQQTISDVLKGKAPGVALARRVAEALGVPLDALLAGTAQTERVVRDERYPNRTRAIRAARELGLSEDAIETVATMALKSAVDPAPEEWLDMIRDEARRLRFAIVAPRQTEAEAARSKAEIDALAEAEKPKPPPWRKK
jgi:transcriptional regulator with XRE-family HTH domain